MRIYQAWRILGRFGDAKITRLASSALRGHAFLAGQQEISVGLGTPTQDSYCGGRQVGLVLGSGSYFRMALRMRHGHSSSTSSSCPSWSTLVGFLLAGSLAKDKFGSAKCTGDSENCSICLNEVNIRGETNGSVPFAH